MWRRASESESSQILGRAEALLGRWRYSLTARGALCIEPVGPELAAEEIGGFLRLLLDVFATEPPTEVIFDLGQVEQLGPSWTLVLAMLIDFAQKIDAPCSIAGVHGQPAAAASLYNRSPLVARLLTANQRASLNDQRRSA